MQFNSTTSMGTSTVTWDMRLDANEHVYLGFTGTGNTDAVVHRLDSMGNHVWSTTGIALGHRPIRAGDAFMRRGAHNDDGVRRLPGS